MTVDFPYVPKHFFEKNHSYTVSDFIYQHRNFSIKLKKIERKIIDLQCRFITKKWHMRSREQ